MIVWFVIPAFNEGPALDSVLREIIAEGFQVVVVDDCSKDETSAVALRAGAHVCRHPVNLGQGAALQTGFEYALSYRAEAIVTFDADGQHCLRDAKIMISRLAEEDVDVVLGSRFLGETVGMTGGKRLLLKMATLYTKLTSGLSVTDTHNGLRCFNRKSAEQMRIRHNRMAHASEILNKIGALGLRYVEVPCTITYSDYSRAKGQKLTGAFAILADLALGKLYR